MIIRLHLALLASRQSAKEYKDKTAGFFVVGVDNKSYINYNVFDKYYYRK